jgi:hypothetical protein
MVEETRATQNRSVVAEALAAANNQMTKQISDMIE